MAKRNAKPKIEEKPRMQYLTYWLTRDGDPETGEPLPTVDVWYSRPNPTAVGSKGRIWLDRLGLLVERHATWSLADCRLMCGTVPDSAMMLVRVGPEHETRDVLNAPVAVAST